MFNDRELSAFSEQIGRLYACGHARDWLETSVEVVETLIPCDYASFAFNASSHLYKTLWISRVREKQEALAEMHIVYAMQHPTQAECARSATARPIRLQDHISQPRLRDLPVFSDLFRPLAFNHQLGAQALGGLFTGLGVQRSGPVGFDDKEFKLFDLVQQHIGRAGRMLVDRHRGRLEIDGEMVDVTIGSPANVDDACVLGERSPTFDSTMRRLWPEYNGKLPAEMIRWIQRQRETRSLGRLNGAPIDMTPMVIHRNGVRVLARLSTQKEIFDRQIVLFENLVPADPFAHLMSYELTERETEVVRWVAEGKTNPEIGLILDISRRTVQKHLEHVFVKLSVENRQTLILKVMESANSFGGNASRPSLKPALIKPVRRAVRSVGPVRTGSR